MTSNELGVTLWQIGVTEGAPKEKGAPKDTHMAYALEAAIDYHLGEPLDFEPTISDEALEDIRQRLADLRENIELPGITLHDDEVAPLIGLLRAAAYRARGTVENLASCSNYRFSSVINDSLIERLEQHQGGLPLS